MLGLLKYLSSPDAHGDAAIRLFAKGIADEVGIDEPKIEKKEWEEPKYVFDILSVNVHDLFVKHTGSLYFTNEKEYESFNKEFLDLIEKYTTTPVSILAKTAGKIIATPNEEIEIIKNLEMPVDSIVNAAKNVNVDLQKIVDDNITEVAFDEFGF